MGNYVGLFAILIPIVALLIPILAILLKSDLGKSLAKYYETKALSSSSGIESLIKTEQFLLTLDQRMERMEKNMQGLKQSHDNLTKMLVQADERRQLPE